jgi:hypothetical protein
MKGHKGIHHHGHVKHMHHGHVMHHHKKKGGAVEEGTDVKEPTPSDVYAGKESPTVKEAEKRKHGGRAHKKHGGKVDGYKGGGRFDRHPRAKGGRTGAEMRPLSAAHGTSERPGAAMESEHD